MDHAGTGIDHQAPEDVPGSLTWSAAVAGNLSVSEIDAAEDFRSQRPPAPPLVKPACGSPLPSLSSLPPRA
jgi:hypothetical protein